MVTVFVDNNHNIIYGLYYLTILCTAPLSYGWGTPEHT